MLKRITVLLLGLVLMNATLASGHEGKRHVMGVVTGLNAKHVLVKTKDGKTVSILLTRETKYFKGQAGASATDLMIGIRVVVDVTGEGAKATASEIRLGTLEVTRSEEPKPGSKKSR